MGLRIAGESWSTKVMGVCCLRSCSALLLFGFLWYPLKFAHVEWEFLCFCGESSTVFLMHGWLHYFMEIMSLIC